MSQETLDLIGQIETVVFGIVMMGGMIALLIVYLSDPNKDKNKKAS